MDADVFPIGKKSKTFIINHLKFILAYAEKRFDILIIACNSMSSFLSFIDLSEYKLKVYSIFEENLKSINDDVTFIGTSATLSNVSCMHKIALDQLPSLIENNEILKIINCIDRLQINTHRAILGCTHFPFIKFIFEDMWKDVIFLSNEDNIISQLPDEGILRINGNKKARKYLDDYLNLGNKILC